MSNAGSISLLGLLGLVAFVLLATSFYFYMKNKHEAVTLREPIGLPAAGTSTDAIGNGGDAPRYAQKCGISVSVPTIGVSASFPLTIKGTIDNRNRKALGCMWTIFEGQAGTAQVFANIHNAGWKEVGYWMDNPSGAIAGAVPIMTVGEWMTSNPVEFATTLRLDPKAGIIPVGTPMKIVMEDDDPSGDVGEMLEVPFVYGGENKDNAMPLKLFFPMTVHMTDCGATYPVVRVVPKTLAVADASMRELFEVAIPSLKNHYNGITIRNKVAVIDFDKGALGVLDGPACTQQSVKSPIEKTLLQYPTIKSVEYSIDGVVKKDWDA